MSGWIKLEKDLLTDPRVLRVARILERAYWFIPTSESECDPCNAVALPAVTLALGGLAQLWILADTHVGQDDILSLGADEINEFIGLKGFCEILPHDWLEVIDADHVKLPGFHTHNGTQAKKKAQVLKRVTRHRGQRNAQAFHTRNGHALPDQDQDQDQDQTKTRPKQDKEKISIPSESHSGKPEIAQVFEHWKLIWGHPRASLDAKRCAAITRALKGYRVADLCASISGYRNSPHHTGQNDRNTVFDDIGLLLRDSAHIDAGLRFAESPPTLSSELTQHNVAVLSNWKPPEDHDAPDRRAAISSSPR